MVSIPKLLILILLGVGGWYLYKMIKRRGIDGILKGGNTPESAKTGGPKALDMEKYRICGDFVPADARACAQDRCPYPQH